ncbi:DUF3427 domain-containing protein [Leptotrichia sp. oral taxon 847]|uniref:DUF3427 domain-containing protein n=1 Tax=Leptotrichia sp. oral taxon 847 TaxID=1785996 RepID=UPI000768429C|nr:DUF3427 domain-containing protein [Leptotrichia sp. oral taxon 847]AMD94201.1 type III restriction endonuclease subunit R [Leptotrichia sp. oral taxon 847]
MSILLQKDDLNLKNESQKIVEIKDYEEKLKFELIEYFSKEISFLIKDGSYQDAIDFVQNRLNIRFEIPLKQKEKDITGNLNELILNEKTKFKNFFIYLKNELLNCKKFHFIVSFIRYSGLQILLSTLDELEKKGIKGEIITSVYLNITDSKSLRKLLSYKNIKVKIYNNSSESFHTKAYLFEKNKYHTCIIGSSNISQSALYSAEEWNVKLTESNFFEIYKKSISQFKNLWNSDKAIELSEDFIFEYENYKNNLKLQKTFDYRKVKNNKNYFEPNSMQKELLEKLKNTRKSGNKKGLVVAATGTGKTYLAAMDIKNFFEKKEKKFLFLAHREELLENAILVCKKIMKIGENKVGRIFGGKKETEKKIIFATVQSLQNNYLEFSKDYFDYIVIDEFHHSSAKSYTKILNYFNPKFLLGLTATPERMDGKDILELCDYNLVGEMGLKRAMEQDLLAPFHYFGINDETFDYEKIPYKNGKYQEDILVKNLLNNKRVDYIIEKIKKIGFDGEKMSCIAFCENINHANFMNKNFNKNGYISEILTSRTSKFEREKILEDFKNKKSEILCVVDILNEGIDIPNINLLLFLRPTFSSTIFTQQIGRGLRKCENKDFVTIIDFIGNHKKDYIIAKFFYEEMLNNKNILYIKKEKLIKEIKTNFESVPMASYVELDRICQERIINKIEKINFNSKIMLKEAYDSFKNEIGKNDDEILEILDFDRNIELFIELSSKYDSFYTAQKNLESNSIDELNFSNIEFLSYLEKKLTLVEPFTYLIVDLFLDKKTENITESDVLKKYKNYFNILEFKNTYLIKRILKELLEDKILDFESNSEFKNKKNYKLSKKYKDNFFKDKNFLKRLKQLIILGLSEFKNNDISQFNENILINYKEYKRIELQILLDSKVPKGSWRAGYANTEKDICLFVTYDKSHILQENLKYDNSLHSDDIIQWISQPKTYHTSSVGQMFIKHREKGIKVHIFVRKFAFLDNKKTNPFIYLGNANYYKSYGDKPMTILWKLKNKIPFEIIKDVVI